MARIFTTKFKFNHQVYDAIVTVISSEGKLNFNVRVMDAELHDLIPGGHIKYEGREGFKELEADNRIAQNLVHSIVSSIEEHLVTKP